MYRALRTQAHLLHRSTQISQEQKIPNTQTAIDNYIYTCL
jgi:hypothetical protein